MGTTRTQIVRYIRNGKDGEPGKDGNGISGQVSLFVATNRKEGVTHENTTGWTEAFATPTEELPYTWKCVRTAFTQTGTTYSATELVAVYQAGVNANLLENAAFVSEAKMGAWELRNTYVNTDGTPETGTEGHIDTELRKDGRNSYHDDCMLPGDSVLYKEVLQQKVYGPEARDKKLEGGR